VVADKQINKDDDKQPPRTEEKSTTKKETLRVARIRNAEGENDNMVVAQKLGWTMLLGSGTCCLLSQAQKKNLRRK